MTILKHFFSGHKEPEILIQYGRLIDPFFIFYSKNYPNASKFGWDKWTPPNKEQLDKKISIYREEWKKYDLAKKISDCLGMSFKRNVLDVYIISGTPRDMSNPLIIRSGLNPEEFVTTLAHELIHRILSINGIPKIVFDEKENDTTNNHVIVFAVLKKILDNELWELATTSRSKHPSKEYARARELAEQIGTENVIKMMTGQSI